MFVGKSQIEESRAALGDRFARITPDVQAMAASREPPFNHLAAGSYAKRHFWFHNDAYAIQHMQDFTPLLYECASSHINGMMPHITPYSEEMFRQSLQGTGKATEHKLFENWIGDLMQSRPRYEQLLKCAGVLVHCLGACSPPHEASVKPVLIQFDASLNVTIYQSPNQIRCVLGPVAMRLWAPLQLALLIMVTDGGQLLQPFALELYGSHPMWLIHYLTNSTSRVKRGEWDRSTPTDLKDRLRMLVSKNIWNPLQFAQMGWHVLELASYSNHANEMADSVPRGVFFRHVIIACWARAVQELKGHLLEQIGL